MGQYLYLVRGLVIAARAVFLLNCRVPMRFVRLVQATVVAALLMTCSSRALAQATAPLGPEIRSDGPAHDNAADAGADSGADAGVDGAATQAAGATADASAPTSPTSSDLPNDSIPDPRLWTEHGHMTTTAVRTTSPPKIDGILNDQVWSVAPIDNRFRDAATKPYGLLTKDPTEVQVAYDNDYIYVAFRCSYADPASIEPDAYPTDKVTLFTGSESVTVQIDARHDHNSSRAFTLTRTGMRADWDATQNAVVLNTNWRGIWDSATSIQGDKWYAEFRIPWETVGLPPHDGDFSVGINFRRILPRIGVKTSWALPPPTPGLPNPPSFAGHLVGLSDVHPGNKLYIQPFLLGRYRSNGFFAEGPASRLRDFTGSNSNLGVYGGIYARYRPIGALQLDLTANPDFSQVPPDEALANLDRFELVRPETRPFFAEDRGRFEFGADNAQLFYSRRVGLRADGSSFTEVPILYAGKAVVRQSGTEAAVMSVGLSDPTAKNYLEDKLTVARLNHFFGKSTHLGNILMFRSNGTTSYSAAGVDGAVSFINENLVLSGFLAESTTTATTDKGAGGVGQADIHWSSADFEARLTYLGVSTAFDPQLGYFQLTGIKSVTGAGGYTPILNNDFVREIDLRVQVSHTTTQDDQLVYDRANVSFGTILLNGSLISVGFLPSLEGVQQPFSIAGGRVRIPAGRYDNRRVQAGFSSPPGRTLVVSAGYTEGDLFYGYQRAPQLQVGVNVQRFWGSALYRLFLLHMGNDDLVGHQVSSRMTYSYSPLARSVLAIEANTLDPRATAQLVNSYTFGQLSTVNLILQRSAIASDFWFSRSALSSVILSFAYGLSLL